MLQTITKHLKRFKHAKRGLSNVIVVMLSLVILVVISANVILWSYQMNQLDWEKMKEGISITNVESITKAFYPNGYNVSYGTHLSGTLSDLQSNDVQYMTFRSYASATSAQTLTAHNETTIIGASTYYLLKLVSADGTALEKAAASTAVARVLLGKWVYQLTGVSSIPTSTWTFYYRTAPFSTGSGAKIPTYHIDVDIAIRRSDDVVRTSWAHVANSPSYTAAAFGTYTTLSATYDWAAYTVADQTDYLEIDFYADVTTSGLKSEVRLSVDDNAPPIADQTQVTNVMLPSEFTSEVEFTGTSNTYNWTQLVWTIDSAWTTETVTVTLQLYNYTLGAYPMSGNGFISYTSSATANTDETKTQTITTNSTHFRDGSGNWKVKVKGVKTTTAQFDFKADWIEFKITYEARFTFQNDGALTSHLISLWVNTASNHQRYDINLLVNSGENTTYARADINLPTENFVVKVVTERGNIAVFARH